MSTAPGNGGTPTPESCAWHIAATEQVQNDARLLHGACRRLDKRIDEQETAVGMLTAEVAECRKAAHLSAEKAMATLTEVQSLNRSWTSTHERLAGRVSDLEHSRERHMPSLADDMFSDDTQSRILCANDQQLMSLLVRERERAVAAESRLSERNRVSDRAMAKGALSVQRWKIYAGIIASITGALAAYFAGRM